MKETKVIWMNGNWVPWKDAKIHVLTHSLHYGGAAFEGIRVYKTADGPAVFRLKEHLERLEYSCRALHLKLGHSVKQMTSIVKKLLQKNQLEEGYIRPLAYYGYKTLGVNPRENPTDLMFACWAWESYFDHTSISVKTSSFIRIHPKSSVVDAKITGHYVNSIMANLELQGTHYDEALFLDYEGWIAEGVGENFFMIKGGKIYTPKLGRILCGLTRDTIINLVKSLGYTVVEKNLKIEQAYKADEAFFCGTAAEVTPIHALDDKMIGNGKIGKISERVRKEYFDVVRGKNKKFKNYLTVL